MEKHCAFYFCHSFASKHLSEYLKTLLNNMGWVIIFFYLTLHLPCTRGNLICKEKSGNDEFTKLEFIVGSKPVNWYNNTLSIAKSVSSKKET